MRILVITALFLTLGFAVNAQNQNKAFTHSDTLRGSITPERAWWDVQRYDILIKPVFKTQFTSGSNLITYKVVEKNHPEVMQIDLKEPLKIDSIVFDGKQKLTYFREGSVFLVKTASQALNSVHNVQIYFSGNPHVAVRAPWDGGWTFTKDENGRPWMTVTCQGLGASIWYPNKDHQSDEPDNGASLTMIVPNDLVGVANGKLLDKTDNKDGTTSYKWGVENPISNYTLIPYIGNYVNFSEKYLGLKGNLDLNYWVLDYNLEKAKNYLPREVRTMLNAFEYWFGPYPFYEDGYKLVETEHTGMEHQSAVAYGNHYKPGYRGRDLSYTGLGMNFDFIVIHESGHEWFGNNITTKDLADMYVHESFTNYSETLFVDYNYGEEAANDYNFGTRRDIHNDKPIIPPYGVNAQGSGDMYPKGGNMIHSMRHSVNNDKLFRNILAGLNQTFHNKTVTSDEIQQYFSAKAEYDFSTVFDQYLTTTQIPELDLYVDGIQGKMYFKWSNCISGFDLPLSLVGSHEQLKIYPTEKWQNTPINAQNHYLFDPSRIEKMYYVKVNLVKEAPENAN